jgi:hypothetical protein
MQAVDDSCAYLATAHGQRGECVLEALLKAQELDHAEGHGGVEAQATLVGADGAGELQMDRS